MFFFHNWHRVLGRIVPTAASILLISSLRGFFFCEFQREPSQSPSVITIKKTVIGDVTRRPLKGLGLGHDNNLSSLAEIASLSIVFKTLEDYCESTARSEEKVLERLQGYKLLDFPQSASTSNGGSTCVSHSPRATKFSSERPLAGGQLISLPHETTRSISKLCIGEGYMPKKTKKTKNNSLPEK